MPEVAIYNLQNIKFQIVLVLVSCQTKSMWVILEIFHDVLGVPGPDVIGKINNLQRIDLHLIFEKSSLKIQV